MRIYKIGITFLALFSATLSASAQWVGSDEQPVEPAQKEVSNLGLDRTTPSVPGGPSAVVTVTGEGYGTPPVYVAKPEQIAALKLNKKQEALLKAEFPAFTPWTLTDYGNSVKYYPFSKRQLPFAIKWDFNEAGTPATVITGHDKDRNYVVIFKPVKGGYKLIKRNAGFINSTIYTPKTLPVLRLLRKGSVIRVTRNCNPPFTKEIWHTGFADMSVAVSTKDRPVEWFQSDITDRMTYYHEGLFPMKRTHVMGLKPVSPAVFNEKYIKDISLTAEIQKALANYNKDFKIWENRDYPTSSVSGYKYSGVSLPYAIKYDLNSDGIDDMVVAGHDNDSNMVLELLSGTSGYSVRSVGVNEPCYSSARERKEVIELKPSHVLSLYRKGTDFTGLRQEAVNNFWRHNSETLIGIRMLNTCLKPDKPRTGREEGTNGDNGVTNCPGYGGWLPRPSTEKDEIFVYAEKEDSEGDGCNGSDDCRLEALPPGTELK